MSTVIFATGHRPQNLDGDFTYSSKLWKNMKEQLIKFIEIKQPDMMVSGMALGVDTIWALIAINADIPLYAAVPCRTQPDIWRSEQKKLYDFILSKAKIVKIISESYTRSCMDERNQHMVDISTEGVSVWNEKPGGTANCVNYARSKGVPVTNFDPRLLTL